MSNLFKSKFILGLVMVLMFVVANVASAYTFTMPLKLGTRNADVMALQQLLNANGFTVSMTGAGSPGLETTYFGSRTKTGVIAFQRAKGLGADGIVGPITRAALNAMGSVSGNFPAGCNSAAGYSPSTGMPCNGMVGNNFPAGCSSASGFSSSTGMPCNGTTNLPAGCSSTSGFSATTGAPCNGGVTVNNGPVAVMLATNNPASMTLVAGQATADLAHFTFTGNGVVTGVTLQRLGVSADTTLSNVYLFDGAMRLTDAASVGSNGKVTFSAPAGLFTVNGSKTISVKSDIAASTSGQTVGIQLASFTTSAGTVNANLSGNIHTIAAATLATVSAGTVTPSGATLNPGPAVTVWQSTLNVSNRDVWMKRLALRNVGSAPASAFANFKLFVNGVQVGTATGLDINGYVTFDLMSSPVLLMSGSRVVRVDADIVSGASRTVNFSLRNAADVDLVDSSFGVNISPTATPWGPSANNVISGTSGGTLTIEKDVTSPSANVTLAGNDVTLATFKMTAYGEPIKVETLTVGHTTSVTATLRNAHLLLSTDGVNWVQYGSTATLVAAGTSFTTNYTVNPGTPVWVKVNADVYDNDVTQSIVAGTTITINLLAGSSNAQRIDSLGSFNAPASTVSGNQVTVASASAVLAKNATYANQTTTLPATNFKIGSYTLAGSSVEDILLTTVSVDIDESVGTEFDEGDLTNIYMVVKNSAGTIVSQPAPLSTGGTGADLNFSLNYTLVKNTNVTIELFANLADDGLDMVAGVSGGSNAIDSTDAFATDLTVTGTALVSGTAVTATSADTTGQAIAYGTATITASADAANPVAAIVYDNQTVTTLAAKFAAVTAGYNVTDAVVTVADATNVTSVMLYDGATLVATMPGAASVTFSGLNWNVPSNTNKVLTVKLALGTVGIGAGTTGASILTTLTGFTAVNTSTGVSAAGTGSAAGPAMYVYAATPTITNVALPTTTLTNGTATVSKFSVASNGGTIGWKKFVFTINKVMSGTDTLASATLWDADTNTQIAGTATFTGSVEVDNDTAGGLTFVATNEQQISGTKNYVLKMTVAGATTAGDYLSVYIDQLPTSFAASNDYATVAATTATFVWTDQSAASHSTTTTDWSNSYLVKNLPTDTQVLTY
ncbi:MAG: peptidoglycan-binding protein [bacterium]|nr:peptidoglycan-binding protein [bacterium]